MSFGRSIHRPKDKNLPSIAVRWTNDSNCFHLKSSHLEYHPFFGTFDKDFFMEHFLPSQEIPYRNDHKKTVHGNHLGTLIENLIKEIHQKKKVFKDFKVIARKNFNRKRSCGMMVLKFNDYPFVLKIFIETPKTFTNPYCKGLDNIWFFPLGGGVSRHLSGLTRLKNAHYIKEKIAQHPTWSKTLDVPNKWYWAPSNHPWLEIQGTNIGGYKTICTQIPSTYAIIADAIEADGHFSMFNKEDSSFALSVCNYLELRLDPHINNFMPEKNTGKIVIVDTEHFPTVVGIKEPVTFDNYYDWYTFLIKKCSKDWFFRTKNERDIAQKSGTIPRF